jgi:hypothetical protein
MTPGARSGLTLVTLLVLLAGATAWGWNAFTAPLPVTEEVPICEETEVAAGETVTRDQVVVSVFNGSTRNGLAGATRDLLVERDFVAGETGNAPSASEQTVIVSNDPDNPAVRLVRRQFRGAEVVEGEPLGIGVSVIVGESFESLRGKQVKTVKAFDDTSFCRATGSED